MDFPDIPDRIIDLSEVRLWRFQASPGDRHDFRVPSDLAIPIFGDNQQWLGALTVYGSYILGACDAACPERLDFENGESIYLVPVLAADDYTRDGGDPLAVGFRFSRTSGGYGIRIEKEYPL